MKESIFHLCLLFGGLVAVLDFGLEKLTASRLSRLIVVSLILFSLGSLASVSSGAYECVTAWVVASGCWLLFSLVTEILWGYLMQED